MSEEDRNNFKTYMSKKKDFTDLIIKDKEDNYYYSAIYVNELQQETERLNNIINEFDKWLLGEKMMFYKGSDGETLIRYGETTNKWLELKGDESNGR